jgi:hypothetical protein
VAILLVALVIAASAAAAVLSLTRSQPLAGRVPGAITPASVAGYRYTITVFPRLAAGTAGWESRIFYSRPGTRGDEGHGGSLPATPIWGGGGPITPSLGDVKPLAGGEIAFYLLTGPQVWAVRLGSQTIPTVASRSLPTGDRAVVFFVPATGRPWFSLPGLPAEPPPGKQPAPMKNIPTLLPLDRSGHVIATHLAPPFLLDEGSLLTWMAPDAVTRWWPLQGLNIEGVPYHHDGYPGRAHPGPGVCELAQHGLPALHAEFGHTVAWIAPLHDAVGDVGEVFVSCIDAEYYLHDWPLQAAVLVDGHRPGQVLGPIPGARPVPGHPDMVNLPLGQVPWNYDTRITADSPQYSLTAKRVANAWLVVQGGHGLAQRVQVLNALRISKLDLYHLTSGHAPH